MNQRTKATASAATIIIIFAIMFSSVSTVQGLAAVPRSQTVWGAGQGQVFGLMNPYCTSNTPDWTTFLMYEPLFGINVATNTNINWLGRSIAWINSTELVITLKSDAHWTALGTTLATNTTAVTADDCIYSYKLMETIGNIPSLLERLAGHHVSTSFVKVNATAFAVNTDPAYADSAEVYRGIVNQLPIVPMAVWVDINNTINNSGGYVAPNASMVSKNLNAFANDWLGTYTNTSSGKAVSFPAKWMVSSGMYLPYYEDAQECVAVINGNWWGKDDAQFGRLPVPMFWGYTQFSNNGGALLALEQGDLDWDGNYIPGLSVLKTTYPNLATYQPNLPYFPDKAADELVFNYQPSAYPLNETAIHQAIMSVLNYSQMSQVDSSYLKTPNIMLIPADDASAQALFNKTISDHYTIAFDGTGAAGKALLATVANYDATSGYWFTKAVVGGKHVPLAEWDGASNATIKPWTILDFNGWTDVDEMDTIAATACTTLLNLKVNTDQGLANGWGVVQGRVGSGKNGYNGGFDIFNMVMSGQINMNMYERYFQQFSLKNSGPNAGGTVYAPLGNCTRYMANGALMSALIDKLDNNTGAAQQAIANQIQTIIGQDLPIVPLGGHPDWEIYSTTYWTNWPNSESNPIQAAGPYIGASQMATNLLTTWLLKAAPAPAPTTGIDPMVFAGVVIVIIVVAVVAIVLVMRRKPSK